MVYGKEDGELYLHWSDEESASNVILIFLSSFFKNGCLPDSCSFIRNTMMCTDVSQRKYCRSTSAEINDYNFNEKDVNDDDSDDDSEHEK